MALLHTLQLEKFEKFEPAFDALIARKLILTYTDVVEMDENVEQAQKQRLAYQKVKTRVMQKVAISLGLAKHSRESKLTSLHQSMKK